MEQPDKREPQEKLRFDCLDDRRLGLVALAFLLYLGFSSKLPQSYFLIAICAVVFFGNFAFLTIEFKDSWLELRTGFLFRIKIPYSDIISARQLRGHRRRTWYRNTLVVTYRDKDREETWSMLCDEIDKVYTLLQRFNPNVEIIRWKYHGYFF